MIDLTETITLEQFPRATSLSYFELERMFQRQEAAGAIDTRVDKVLILNVLLYKK